MLQLSEKVEQLIESSLDTNTTPGRVVDSSVFILACRTDFQQRWAKNQTVFLSVDGAAMTQSIAADRTSELTTT